MKWISEEDLKKHIISDNCDEGCGYIDERDIIDMEWVEDDKFIPLFVISDVLDKIKADLWMKGVNMTDEYQGVWVRYRDIERTIDKYKASPTGAERSDKE